MAFLILSAACIAMVAANSYAPAADTSYGAAAPALSYPSSGGVYVDAYPDHDDYYRGDKKNDFRKLKDLHKEKVFDAEIKYYKHKGTFYAVISCKPNSAQPKQFTWILANSDEKIPSFGIEGTVALAGGLNVQYVAKYKHGKWVGHDYEKDDKHKFRRVGCHYGETKTIVRV